MAAFWGSGRRAVIFFFSPLKIKKERDPLRSKQKNGAACSQPAGTDRNQAASGCFARKK